MPMPSIDAIDVCALTRIEYAALLLGLPTADAYDLIHQRVQDSAAQARATVEQMLADVRAGVPHPCVLDHEYEEDAQILALPTPTATISDEAA